MFRVTRTAVAAALTLALAAVPVVLDRCTETCEAHRNTVASAPPCHHVTATGTHLSQAAAACGHDHNGTAVAAANNPAPTGRAFDSVAAVASELTVASPAASDLRVRPHAPPGSALTLDGRSLPLRV